MKDIPVTREAAVEFLSRLAARCYEQARLHQECGSSTWAQEWAALAATSANLSADLKQRRMFEEHYGA